MTARISIIASLGKDRGIGYNNALLFHIPEDVVRFKKLTLHHPVIMGRKTFESIGRVLPERMNIVISRTKHDSLPGVVWAQSIPEAVTLAKQQNTEEIFIIGGGEIYAQALPFTNRLYLTHVDKKMPADTYFPDYNDFNKVIEEKFGNYEGMAYTFLTLEKN